MIQVLFVCLGNICRSPLAEGIFKKLVREAGLEQVIDSDSAGTSRWHIDEPPDTRSIQIAENNNVHLDHLGKQIIRRDLDKFDYILAMDNENLENILSLQHPGQDHKAKIMMMRDFDDQRSGTDIPDPYYGGQNGFQHVFDLLEESLSNFLDFLIRDHHLKS
ncbi:MAG: low molecular weight phosphotyrosine protein phosphatase [Cyclobacteriaceae bacterium]|nr:low molecular weight phosphotyrosine protein phosphatase [Cyclobacteriaceae bacterium]